MKDFRFTDKLTGPNIDAVATLLIQPRLWVPNGDYPAHLDWREKALAQLASGDKRMILSLWGEEPAGSIIYQQHPKQPDTVEIRNISIEPDARGRRIASFLLRQAEQEAADDFPGTERIIVDTKRTNTGLLAFVLANGYKFEATTLLEGNYAHNGNPDVIFSKSLVRESPQNY